MTKVNVYLAFRGNCRAAFEFYSKVFGKALAMMSTFGEMPQGGGPPVPEEEKDLVMHVALPISAETMIMGSDTPKGYREKMTIGNNFSISIDADDRPEADRLYAALSEGGMATMPLHDSFWGSYFGMLTDQFGIQWMISVDNATSEG